MSEPRTEEEAWDLLGPAGVARFRAQAAEDRIILLESTLRELVEDLKLWAGTYGNRETEALLEKAEGVLKGEKA